ncbi:type II toxin-antitoxin system RelE/ParE family toxin [Cnuella takakiae]|uniref:type II toxin-antitoxin system RelE/ParE family toxin n=1 Tax=Cnuella takakiae TaxID=1302690 RepID=UPI0009F9E573|nr:type II toxin-antitoxin system RelE/ParE family toxin [Cnuella takakiae]
MHLTDLRIPPTNRLEKLSGNLKAFSGIRINDQWRIIFKGCAMAAHQLKWNYRHKR